MTTRAGRLSGWFRSHSRTSKPSMRGILRSRRSSFGLAPCGSAARCSIASWPSQANAIDRGVEVLLKVREMRYRSFSSSSAIRMSVVPRIGKFCRSYCEYHWGVYPIVYGVRKRGVARKQPRRWRSKSTLEVFSPKLRPVDRLPMCQRLFLQRRRMRRTRNGRASQAPGHFVKLTGLDDLVKLVSEMNEDWIAEHCTVGELDEPLDRGFPGCCWGRSL